MYSLKTLFFVHALQHFMSCIDWICIPLLYTIKVLLHIIYQEKGKKKSEKLQGIMQKDQILRI